MYAFSKVPATLGLSGFMTSIFHDVDLDVQSYRPILVYLNGKRDQLEDLRASDLACHGIQGTQIK